MWPSYPTPLKREGVIEIHVKTLLDTINSHLVFFCNLRRNILPQSLLYCQAKVQSNSKSQRLDWRNTITIMYKPTPLHPTPPQQRERER